MKNILLLVLKDFKRKWKNPVVILGFLLIPLVFTVIFVLAFGGGEEDILPKISVLAVDKDKSIMSGLFLRSLSQGELKELIVLEEIDEERGRDRLNKGKASALILIPENFEKNIWDGQEIEILLLKNPSEQFLPQIVEEICDVTSLLFSSLLSLFSEELTLVKGFVDREEVTDQDISSISLRIKSRMEGISKYVFPPMISLKEKTIVEEEETQESPLSVSGYILPAMAIMFLLFICNVVFGDIIRERESGTLLRMTISPMKLSEFIWSKIVTSAVIGMLCTFVLIVLGWLIFSINWGNFLLVIIHVICLNIMMAGFIAFLYSFIRTERQAGAVLSSVILIMSMLGGSMIPVENYPPFILNFSKLTLNYWGIQAFQKTMLHDPIGDIIPILLGMVLAGIFFSSLGSFFLEKNLRKGLIK